MKGILIGLLAILIYSGATAQTTGDYRSVNSTAWSTLSTWQRWNGAAWVTPTIGQGYPGENASPTLVTIQTGNTVVADVSPANAIGALTFSANAANSSLSLTGVTLTITNAITFNNPSANNVTQTLAVDNGTITCGSVAMANTTNNTRLNSITINSSGNLTVNGNLTANGAADENYVTLNGTATLNLGGAYTGGTFTVSSTSTVRWFGDNTNFRNDVSYGNLIIEIPASAAASRTKSLTGNLVVQGDFTAQSLHASNTVSLNPVGNNFTVNGATYLNARGNFIDSNNGGTNTFIGSITIAANASFSSGNSSAFVFQGNVDNSGTLSLTAATLSFTGSGDKTITGGGTFTFSGLTLNTTGAANVIVNTTTDITISTALTFSADGLIVLGSNCNLILQSAATITGNSAARYIQLDGVTGSKSQLVKQNSNNIAQWRIIFPIGTSTGGYTPVDLTTGNGAVLATNPTNGSTLSVKAVYNASVQGQLRRIFRLTVTGNAAASTLTLPRISYNDLTDISSGDAESNYSTLWYLSAGSGSWTSVTGTVTTASNYFTPSLSAPQNTLVTGTYYFTIGSSTAYPNVWYSYQTGVWSDWQNWTLDPSGTTLVNGLNLPPQPGDEIVILNGITITNDVSGQVTSTATIQGGATLDMSTTTGNTLGTVSGQGVLRIGGSSAGTMALPTGTYTSFVTAGTGGTIEYYNTTAGAYTLPTGQTTYNKLILSNNTGNTISFISANNLTVNSDFNITQTGGGGTVTWQINNATANRRTLVLNGNLTVSANGRIRASSSGATGPHLLTLYGNLTNNGSIKFFDETDTQLEDADYTSEAIYTTALKTNAVNVTFSGVNNQTVTCNNQTDFYRFIVDKGSGQQATLTVYSSATSNFRLFGPNNLNYTGAAPDFVSSNNLSLVNGTLELTGFINIPSLVVNAGSGIGGGWPIPQDAALWLNSANVSITATNSTDTGDNGRQIYVFGLLKISNGTLSCGYSRGLLGGGSGSFVMEGGTLNTWQLRTTYLGSNNRFSYNQSGGTVNVGTAGLSGTSVTTYPRFALPYAECSFQMSGGELNVANPIGSGGILIFAATANISVSGGTINAILPAATDFTISSTAPFYNLNISKTAAGAAVANLNSMAFNDGTAYPRPAQPLIVKNNLTLVSGNSPGLTCNANNVSIGKNFDVQSGTTYTPGNNVTTFNGTSAQAWTYDGSMTLYDVVLNSSSTLTLGGSQTFPNITGPTTGLTLTAGTLNDGGKILTVTGAISNSAVHTGSGAIVVNGATTIGGNNGTFGNLTIQSNATVATSGNQTVTGTLRLTSANSSLNLAQYSLTVLGNIYSDAGTGVVFGTTKRIYTNGLHNAGGLTRQAADAVDLLFPVGSASIAYTPATINVDVNNSGGVSGTITVRPVSGAHPNVTATGQSVQYYWRVTSSGFSGILTASHKTYTYSSATRDNSGVNYRAARYDPVAFTWGYSNTTYNSSAVPGTTIIAQGAAPYTFETSSGWTNVTGTKLDGEYTAGNVAAFSAVSVFYSRQTGPWNSNTTWSASPCTGPGACGAAVGPGLFPSSNSPVVIGDSNNNHTVTIDTNNRNCGSLQITNGSTLDCSTFTGLNFGANTSVTITGNGTLRIGSANFPAGDFSNFIGTNGGTVEWYGAFTIPTAGPAPQNLALATYYNLIVNATGTMTMPNRDLVIYNDLTKTGASTVQTTTGGARSITVNGNLNFNTGTFTWQNTTATNFNVSGTTTIANGATVNLTGTTALTHTFTTSGSIVNNGTFTLRNTNHVANLVFTGTSNTSLTGTGTPSTTLNFLTVNKGTSQTPTLTIDVPGTISTLTTGWLNLTNGTAFFNNSGTYTLSTSTTTAYSIPSTARLKVGNGTMNIIGDVNNNVGDLSLAGALEITGGQVNINAVGNNRDINNDIEYAAAGSPTIIVSGGALYVNGAIRRPTTTLAGALVYNQSNGTVTIGGRNCDANNTRGVFEIEANQGSSFTMTGGTLNIRRSTLGSAFPDVYINPETSSVSTGSLITVGMDANTAVSQPLSINIVPSIGDFSILNASTAQNVNMISSGLTATGDVTINTNCTLTTNALSVTIGGDLTINGTYIGGTAGNLNTTTFNGTGTQLGVLSAASSFYNMTINKPSGTVQLSGTSPTVTDLNILSGILDVDNLGLTVVGNITNNSSQISTSGGGSIIISGTSAAHTINSSNGSFNNLTLGGTATTKTITVNGDMTITGTLDFTATASLNRYLFIGDNLLTFTATGNTANAGTASSSLKFIKTNGVSSDLGVVKIWPSNTTGTFVYAVGTRTNYTPASLTLTTTAGGGGNITVIPVDNQHPTATALGEQILNYYWIVKRDNAISFSTTGSHVYQFPTSLIGGSGGTTRGAHLDAINLIGWTQPVGAITTSAPNTILTISNTLDTNLPLANGEFHYTVGTANTLPNPITPVYSRFSDNGGGNATNVSNLTLGGNWNLATNWTLESDGTGTGLSVVPTGRPVVILSGARINMNAAGLNAFTTQIDGLLVTTTTGHNLGSISGTGTLQTTTSTLPAGTYTSFVSSAGGTIEYNYTGSASLNNRSTYNNLSIKSGTATMTNTDLTLNGNLNIETGAVLDNSTNNRNINLARNWTNNGTFTPGSGTVTFSGTTAATISGSTSFNNIVISKPGSTITLAGTGITTLNNSLSMTNGYLISSATHPLLVTTGANWTGGGVNSFVQGPIRTFVNAAGTFSFPTGSTVNGLYRPATLFSTSAGDTWTVEYVGNNPSNDGYTITNVNSANLAKVSQFEYWNISRVGAASASVTLSYGSGSYLGSDIGDITSLLVVRWNGTQWDLPPGGGIHTQAGTITTGTVTVTNVTSFSPFAFGSTDPISPLPVNWLSFSGKRVDDDVLLTWSTAQEINNERFEVERSINGTQYSIIGEINSQGDSKQAQYYSYIDVNNSPYQRYYYRLRQVDFDGKSEYSAVIVVAPNLTNEVSKRWMISPNPSNNIQHLVIKDNATDGSNFVQIALYSATGETLLQSIKTIEELNELLNNTPQFKNGIYILQISDDQNTEYFRLIRL